MLSSACVGKADAGGRDLITAGLCSLHFGTNFGRRDDTLRVVSIEVDTSQVHQGGEGGQYIMVVKDKYNMEVTCNVTAEFITKTASDAMSKLKNGSSNRHMKFLRHLMENSDYTGLNHRVVRIEVDTEPVHQGQYNLVLKDKYNMEVTCNVTAEFITQKASDAMSKLKNGSPNRQMKFLRHLMEDTEDTDLDPTIFTDLDPQVEWGPRSLRYRPRRYWPRSLRYRPRRYWPRSLRYR
eukprot:544853_1